MILADSLMIFMVNYEEPHLLRTTDAFLVKSKTKIFFTRKQWPDVLQKLENWLARRDGADGDEAVTGRLRRPV